MSYLILMYLIMTVGFFWNFQWSLVVFSLTWLACLMFRRYLPQTPYPDMYIEKMGIRSAQHFIIFILFISPALFVSLVYQGLLILGGDDFAQDWPPTRITDSMVSQNYPVLLIDKELVLEQGFEVVYLFTSMMRNYFFVFAFFVSHWFLFSMVSIRNKFYQSRWVSSRHMLRVFSWKFLMVLFVGLGVYWMASYVYPSAIGSRLEKPGLGQLVVFVANHLVFLMPLLIFSWWGGFFVLQGAVNIVLLKVFILQRGSGKKA